MPTTHVTVNLLPVVILPGCTVAQARASSNKLLPYQTNSCLCAIDELSRDERPCGSLPAFAGSDVAINRLNSYPPHYKMAFACSAIPYPHSFQLTLRLAFLLQPREVRAYHVPRLSLSGSGLASTPVTPSSAGRGVRSHSPDTNTGHLPFGPSLSASLACSQ